MGAKAGVSVPHPQTLINRGKVTGNVATLSELKSLGRGLSVGAKRRYQGLEYTLKGDQDYSALIAVDNVGVYIETTHSDTAAWVADVDFQLGVPIEVFGGSISHADNYSAILRAMKVVKGGVVLYSAGGYKTSAWAVPEGSSTLHRGMGRGVSWFEAIQNEVTGLCQFNTESFAAVGGIGGGIKDMDVRRLGFTGRGVDNVGWKALHLINVYSNADSMPALYVTQADTVVADNREPVWSRYTKVRGNVASGPALQLHARDVANGAPQVVGQVFESSQFASGTDSPVELLVDSTAIPTPAIQRISFNNVFSFIKANGGSGYRFVCNASSGIIGNITFDACHAERDPVLQPTGTVGLEFSSVAGGSIRAVNYAGELATAERYSKTATGIFKGIEISSTAQSKPKTFSPDILVEEISNGPARVIVKAGDTAEQDTLVEFQDRSGARKWTFGKDSAGPLEVRDASNIRRLQILESGAINFMDNNGGTVATIYNTGMVNLAGSLTVAGDVVFSDLPTSSEGLVSGQLWRSGTIVNVVL